MPHLLAKSESNLNAASILLTGGLFAPSVHCSYYGMLQNLTCKLRSSLNITFEELTNKSISDKRNSHKFLIEETLVIIENRSNRFNKREIKNLIYDLKIFRESSDYQNVSISFEQGTKAFELSTTIIEKLNKYLT